MTSLIFNFVHFALLLGLAGCNRRTFTMPGDAMNPTIQKDDKVVVDTSAYAANTPQRWEVVALHPTKEQDKNMLWALRVVGLPGEELSFSSDDGDVLIGGKPLERPPQLASIRFFAGSVPLGHPYVVPKDCYYVLGDNWRAAYDSRSWGSLPRKNIVGKVVGK